MAAPRSVGPRRKPQLKRYCVFCGGAPLTHEHIFPDWLRPLIGSGGKSTRHTVSRSTPYQSFTVSAGSQERSGGQYERRLRIACGPCNSGWMSRLQTAVKPLLTQLVRGQLLGLDRASQATLARWLAMLSVVIEHADPATMTYQPDEVHAFRHDHRPRPFTTMFIARLNGDTPYAFLHNGGLLQYSDGPTIGSGSTTVPLGRLLLHVQHNPLSAEGAPTAIPRRLAMQKIWPADQERVSLLSSVQSWEVERLFMAVRGAQRAAVQQAGFIVGETSHRVPDMRMRVWSR